MGYRPQPLGVIDYPLIRGVGGGVLGCPAARRGGATNLVTSSYGEGSSELSGARASVRGAYDTG